MSNDDTVHPMFLGASQKLHWAMMKLNDLDIIVSNYNNLFVSLNFIPSNDYESPNKIIVNARDIPFPRPPFIGDIMRNLRGSLDHASSAMMRAVKKRDDNVYFPIGDTEESFKNNTNIFLKKCDSENLTSFFLEEVDARKEGVSKDIWYLNQMDRANKHRQLTVIEEAVVTPMPNMEGNFVLFHECSYQLKPGQIMESHFPYWINPMDSRIRPGSLKITFGPDEAIPGEDVIKVLKDFRDMVLKTLKSLQKKYILEYPERADLFI